ncbi:MAG: TIGR02921 family PEP-CTERM protein [Bacteroidia bacterium]
MKYLNTMISFFSKNWIKKIIFWSWNLVFLITLITVQVNSPFLFEIIKEIFVGTIPTSFGLFSLLMLFFPLLSIYLGIKVFKNQPNKLIQYFYGVQVPILLICLLRISVFRELTLGSGIVAYSVLAGIIFYFYELLKPSNSTDVFKLSLYTLLALIGLYICLIIAFFVAPMASFIIQGLGHLIKEILRDPRIIIQVGFMGFISFIFFSLTATLFIISPIAIIINYFKSFRNAYSEYKHKNKFVYLVPITFSILFIAIIYFTNNKQPQLQAFELTNKTELTIADKENIIKNKEIVKAGLLNAYLAPYRYIDTWESLTFIKEIYKEAFKLEEKPSNIQNAFNGILYPFLYQNVEKGAADIEKSANLYELVFDTPIQKAEKDAIKSALSATWDRDAAKAGMLNIDEEKVLITNQDIAVNESQFAAEVTIHERYLNQTFERLEMFYYFRLPDNAAITGLWLSDTDSISKKYAYRVSPRGAAQKIYNQEVERRVDPSLLEQVGPHQYRLRAFPILPKTKEYKLHSNFEIVEGAPFHLWLTYVTLKEPNGSIPMLQLLEKRNVFWNKKTQRNTSQNIAWTTKNWMPTILAEKAMPAFKDSLKINLNETINICMNAETKATPKHLKLALLLDQSYSMGKYKEQLKSVFLTIKQNNNVQVEIFTNQNNEIKTAKIDENNVDELLFFGIQHPAILLNQFAQNNLPEKYDGIIVLTDEGSYELDTTRLPTLILKTPIILCHINGAEAPVYSDNLFETILSSNGTATTNMEQTIQFLYKNAGVQNAINENQVSWSLANNKELVKSQISTAMLKPIAAQKYIQILMQQAVGSSLSENKNLDLIHQIAVQNSIITPYSSMIVLVDEEQWKRLKEAEQDEDRFRRTTESGKENLSKPWGFGVLEATGTPEPEEWVLIILAGSVLLWTFYQRKI